MKKLGFLVLFALLVATVSIAQNRGSFDPKEMAKRQTDELTKELDLNKDQQKKMLALNQKNAEQMSALREEAAGNGGTREAMREKMTKLREEQTKEIKKILTDEQFVKYEKYLEQRRQMRGQGRPGGGN